MKRFMSKEGDGAQEAYGREREVETLRAPGPTGAIETSVEHLDLATVLKVSQAVSGFTSWTVPRRCKEPS
jgi:hypothetical protein